MPPDCCDSKTEGQKLDAVGPTAILPSSETTLMANAGTCDHYRGNSDDKVEACGTTKGESGLFELFRVDQCRGAVLEPTVGWRECC